MYFKLWFAAAGGKQTGDGDELIHGQIGIHGNNSSHQLGDRCNGRSLVPVFTEQYLPRILVHNKRHA